MRRPIKRTSAPEGFEYYRVCDPEGDCHVVRGLHKVQRLIAEMPELIVTKMPLSLESRSRSVIICSAALLLTQ